MDYSTIQDINKAVGQWLTTQNVLLCVHEYSYEKFLELGYSNIESYLTIRNMKNCHIARVNKRRPPDYIENRITDKNAQYIKVINNNEEKNELFKYDTDLFVQLLRELPQYQEQLINHYSYDIAQMGTLMEQCDDDLRYKLLGKGSPRIQMRTTDIAKNLTWLDGQNNLHEHVDDIKEFLKNSRIMSKYPEHQKRFKNLIEKHLPKHIDVFEHAWESLQSHRGNNSLLKTKKSICIEIDRLALEAQVPLKTLNNVPATKDYLDFLRVTIFSMNNKILDELKIEPIIMDSAKVGDDVFKIFITPKENAVDINYEELIFNMITTVAVLPGKDRDGAIDSVVQYSLMQGILDTPQHTKNIARNKI